uniref:Uncharacterized protein n=1 Tax=Anguilla anguilla TaxID=7936 RepID=A0A0E9TY65_ANGAN
MYALKAIQIGCIRQRMPPLLRLECAVVFSSFLMPEWLAELHFHI